MNYLSHEQIQFTKMYFAQDKDYFKAGFISNRLKKLIRGKLEGQKWEVMQLPIERGVFNFPGYTGVFTAPSKRTVLFTCDRPGMLTLKYRFGGWQKT